MFWTRFYDMCSSIGEKPSYVCKQLGYSNSTSTHWKNGQIPNGEALIKLSEYFKVSIDYLLGTSDSKNPKNGCCRENGDVKIKKIIKYYKSLNESGRQKAVDRMAQLASAPKYSLFKSGIAGSPNIGHTAAFGGEMGKNVVKGRTTAEVVKIKQIIKKSEKK